MLAFIKGFIRDLTPNYVVIETHGVGYQIFIPVSSYAKLAACHEEVQLFTSFIVREDSHRLFGFQNKEQKELFELLSDISGIGPKTALNIVGHMSLEDFQSSILKSDTLSLSKIPGIGKKTSERLIVEMKDKLNKIGPISKESLAGMASVPPVFRDALSALLNLGYQQQSAQKALKKIESEHKEGLDLATLITKALKIIS